MHRKKNFKHQTNYQIEFKALRLELFPFARASDYVDEHMQHGLLWYSFVAVRYGCLERSTSFIYDGFI